MNTGGNGLSGFCMTMRKKTWELVGGFDERFILYGEENDFLDEAHIKHGLKSCWAKNVYVHHFKGKTVEKFKNINNVNSKILFQQKYQL